METHSESSTREWTATSLLTRTLTLQNVSKMCFGYFADSIGKNVETGGENGSWKKPEAILEGNFIVSSFSMNAPNKDNVTYTAEFVGQGMPTVSAAAASAATLEE